jgi:hypothetical protein
MSNYKHYCKEWDFMLIDADSVEYEACICNIDSDGRGPMFHFGDRVKVLPLKLEASVMKQQLSYDCGESFWGNVIVKYDDEMLGECNNWQLEKINNE